MLKSSGAMAVATLMSRVLGMFREMVYAHFMGDRWVAAAFQVAFTIPNLFRRLLGEGALTAAFIPIFKEKEKAGKTEMWNAANAVISGLVIASAAVIVLVLIGITIALGVHEFSAKTDLMLRLLRWMFPYMLLVCVAAVFMGMLNARGHFFIPAMGATLLNIVMIASVLWLAPHWGPNKVLHEQIFALALGVIVAGLAQAAFQVPTLLNDGFRFRWISPWKNATVKRVVQQMIPGTLGVAAFQINVAVIQLLGFWLDRPEAPLIAPFNYAVRLMELPQGVFGISLATFLLPTLSGFASDKNFGEFRSTLRNGIAHLVFINLLMTVLLITLALPIVRLLFERGAFDHGATLRTTLALQCLAGSLVAYSLVNVLARAFYALGDTKTPMKISLACLAFNLVLSVSLVWWFRQGGLGLANTISSALNLGLLLFALKKKLGKLELESLKPTFVPLAAAALAALGTTLWLSHLWETRVEEFGLAWKICAVFVPGGIASALYWALAYFMKVPAAKELLDLIAGRFKRKARA